MSVRWDVRAGRSFTRKGVLNALIRQVGLIAWKVGACGT
jgi:hypothetical protein